MKKGLFLSNQKSKSFSAVVEHQDHAGRLLGTSSKDDPQKHSIVLQNSAARKLTMENNTDGEVDLENNLADKEDNVGNGNAEVDEFQDESSSS